MGEYLLLGAIVGGAIYYLGRILLGRRGSGGCGSCGGSCGGSVTRDGRREHPADCDDPANGSGSGCPCPGDPKPEGVPPGQGGA